MAGVGSAPLGARVGVVHRPQVVALGSQRADNRKVIDRLGGVHGAGLEDGLSAWKKGVRRLGWEELLERAHSGAWIVAWHTDLLLTVAARGYRIAKDCHLGAKLRDQILAQ